jgi:hypothetical protein
MSVYALYKFHKRSAFTIDSTQLIKTKLTYLDLVIEPLK